MPSQELVHQWDDPFVSVFDNIVAAVIKWMRLGMWPVLLKPGEAGRSEAPILHTPNELNGPIGE